MIKNIANVKFRDNNIAKFEHLHIDNLNIKDRCVIETDDGIELGDIINFEDIDLSKLDKSSCCGCCNSHDDDDSNSMEDIEIDSDEEEINIPIKKEKIYHILRLATEKDIEQFQNNKKYALDAFEICKKKVEKYNLNLKLTSAYYFLDRAKLLFEFIADERVDFRELVKDLAAQFRTRIELRQIGVRDEARNIGGCGICGRELCCRLKKSKFETISIKMAKEQSILLNTMKISGQCGRLMCCLAHEYKAYCDLKKDLPKVGTKLIFNGMPSTIKDLNSLNKKLLIETEDKRLIYINASDLQEIDEILVANVDIKSK